MGNVLEKAKQEQVIALGRLGWSLRRIEAAAGVPVARDGRRLLEVGRDSPTDAGRLGRKPPAKGGQVR